VRDYELMVVLDPNLDETAIEAMNTRIQSLVTQRGGTVENVDTWGRKRLAYPIGRFRDGFYILSRLQLPPTAAVEIERAQRLAHRRAADAEAFGQLALRRYLVTRRPTPFTN